MRGRRLPVGWKLDPAWQTETDRSQRLAPSWPEASTPGAYWRDQTRAHARAFVRRATANDGVGDGAEQEGPAFGVQPDSPSTRA